MKTFETLKNRIESANTATVEGRQMVVNACKELYNLIEEDAYNAGCECMLKGMYDNLCNGNFADRIVTGKQIGRAHV